MINRFVLELMDDQMFNTIPFVKFLAEHQNQKIEVVVNQESHCLHTMGVYDLLDQFQFSSVKIKTYNAIEHHDKYAILNRGWHHWLSQKRNYDQNYDYSWNTSKVFGCFFGRPGASRLGIAGYLHYYYPSKSLIKLRFNTSSEDSRKHFELQKLYSWEPTHLEGATSLLQNIDQYSSEYCAYNYDTGVYDYGNPLSYLYKDIFVDLVAEANLNGSSFYPTEKIVRSMLCRKPFIVMAPRYYLKYLKQMGFKTFSDVWDESYDAMHPKDRYLAIISLIDKLASLSINDLQDLTIKTKNITEHNYQILVNNQYNTVLTKIND